MELETGDPLSLVYFFRLHVPFKSGCSLCEIFPREESQQMRGLDLALAGAAINTVRENNEQTGFPFLSLFSLTVGIQIMNMFAHDDLMLPEKLA